MQAVPCDPLLRTEPSRLALCICLTGALQQRNQAARSSCSLAAWLHGSNTTGAQRCQQATACRGCKTLRANAGDSPCNRRTQCKQHLCAGCAVQGSHSCCLPCRPTCNSVHKGTNTPSQPCLEASHSASANPRTTCRSNYDLMPLVSSCHRGITVTPPGTRGVPPFCIRSHPCPSR